MVGGSNSSYTINHKYTLLDYLLKFYRDFIQHALLTTPCPPNNKAKTVSLLHAHLFCWDRTSLAKSCWSYFMNSSVLHVIRGKEFWCQVTSSFTWVQLILYLKAYLRQTFDLLSTSSIFPDRSWEKEWNTGFLFDSSVFQYFLKYCRQTSVIWTNLSRPSCLTHVLLPLCDIEPLQELCRDSGTLLREHTGVKCPPLQQ